MLTLHPPRVPENTWIEILRVQALMEKVADRLGVANLSLRLGQPPLDRDNEMLGRFLYEHATFLHEKIRLANRPDLLKGAEPINSLEKEQIESALIYYEHIDSIHSKSEDFELWQAQTLAPKNLFPLLQLLPIDTRTGIQTENHGMGYHIHYLVRRKRTNVIFLFDREEPPTEFNPRLYWEPHSEGSTIDARPSPDKFGEDRTRNVYATCQSLLKRYSKADFRRLSKKSKLLHPIHGELL